LQKSVIDRLLVFTSCSISPLIAVTFFNVLLNSATASRISDAVLRTSPATESTCLPIFSVSDRMALAVSFNAPAADCASLIRLHPSSVVLPAF
jgi:hypothetical protein